MDIEVLSEEMMSSLIELGLDTSDATFGIDANGNKGSFVKDSGMLPLYTVNDILNKLPDYTITKEKTDLVNKDTNESVSKYTITLLDNFCDLFSETSTSLIHSAYFLLIKCIIYKKVDAKTFECDKKDEENNEGFIHYVLDLNNGNVTPLSSRAVNRLISLGIIIPREEDYENFIGVKIGLTMSEIGKIVCDKNFSNLKHNTIE